MHIKKSLIALAAAAILAIPMGFAAGEPDNVTGLTASPIDSYSVGLSWNSAKTAAGGLVDHYRVYYGIASVQTLGEGDYDHEINTPNNNTSFVISNLAPQTTYYFSVTAVDSGGAESEAYSLEASAATPAEPAAPAEAGSDEESPVVASALATGRYEVLVSFSEPIVLPAVMPEAAFSIAEQAIATNVLNVTGARVSGENNQKVILQTGEQAPNVSYTVTAGGAVTDLAGNPMISGNTDAAIFLGSSLEGTPAPEQPVVTEPVAEVPVAEVPVNILETPAAPAESAEPINCGNSWKCFYEYVRTCTSAEMVETTDKTEVRHAVVPGETNCTLHYEAASILDLENAETLDCVLPKDSMEARARRAMDVEGGSLFEAEAEVRELCAGDYLETFIAGMNAEKADTTPPEDVTNLVISFREQMEKFVAMLRWVASLNSAGDLVNQILYMSRDRGSTYDSGKPLGAEVTSHEVPDLEGGKEYTFKLTTKDAVGNESAGVIKSIRLPQTGAAAGLLLFGSALGAGHMLRRKSK